jgi:hypothetical protein
MKNWREQVKLMVGEENVYDPAIRDFRGRELSQEDCEKIVRLDLAEVLKSDIVFANCWKRGYGTIMELVYAKIWNKEIIVVLPDNPVPVFVRTHADYVTDNIYDGIMKLQEYMKQEVYFN